MVACILSSLCYTTHFCLSDDFNYISLFNLFVSYLFSKDKSKTSGSLPITSVVDQHRYTYMLWLPVVDTDSIARDTFSEIQRC